MRKIIAFGLEQGFVEQYADFLTRNGFDLETYRAKKNGTIDLADTPVLMVNGGELGREELKALGLAVSTLKKPQIILISSENPGGSEIMKKVKKKAAHTLGKNFLKKDLLGALRTSDEVLGLRESAAVLKAELSQKDRVLSCMLDVTKLLSSSLDFSRAINRIMERTKTMVKAQAWALFLVDVENNSLMFNAARGITNSRDIRFRLKPGEGIAGWAMQDMEPKVVRDVTKEPRFAKAVDKATGVDTRSVMAVPILVKGRLLGVAELINKESPAGFTNDDIKMVRILMNQTALAVERSELYQRMEDLAVTDDLTKLFNLRYLDRTLDVELERATRYNLEVSLIFMDIDFFKHVNDRYGHLVGSKLLVEVSQLLLKGLRKIDIVARYGGDEFVIVLPQTGVEAAKMIAERLRKTIEKNTFLKSQNMAINLTASFGIASFPKHAASQEELLRLADDAMYRVKYQTRNDVYVVGT